MSREQRSGARATSQDPFWRNFKVSKCFHYGTYLSFYFYRYFKVYFITI